jgi:hypothetical protein|tara:strand:- start:7814 stop:8470 length:657 start_codon:yes stop_codon:yes gene_type:complete
MNFKCNLKKLNTQISGVKKTDYLSTCDLINKYNIKNIYNKPKLDKIVLELNLENLINSSDFSDKEQTNSNLQTLSYLTAYILKFKPYINFNKSKLSLSKSTKLSVPANYSLKLSFSTKSEINNFLSSFFTKKWSELNSDDFSFLEKPKKNQTSLNKLVLNTTVSSVFFPELEEFFKKDIGGVNSKNLRLKLNFSFSNPLFLKDSDKVIKNLPFFWSCN